MTEERIDTFCNVCDLYRKDAPCCISGKDFYDQQRYVIRNWCGWAVVDGIRVEVEKDVVILHKKKFSRNDHSELVNALRAEMLEKDEVK